MGVHTAQSDASPGDTLSDTAIDDEHRRRALRTESDTAEATSDTDVVGGQRGAAVLSTADVPIAQIK